VDLGNDVACAIIKLGSISFCIPLGDVLELDDGLYVPSLTKCLLSVSCIKNLQCMAEFDSYQVIIRKHILELGQVLVRGVQDGSFYSLLVDPIEKVWQDAMIEECSSGFVEIVSKPIMESMVIPCI
jgi:hypothetical protein